MVEGEMPAAAKPAIEDDLKGEIEPREEGLVRVKEIMAMQDKIVNKISQAKSDEEKDAEQ